MQTIEHHVYFKLVIQSRLSRCIVQVKQPTVWRAQVKNWEGWSKKYKEEAERGSQVARKERWVSKKRFMGPWYDNPTQTVVVDSWIVVLMRKTHRKHMVYDVDYVDVSIDSGNIITPCHTYTNARFILSRSSSGPWVILLTVSIALVCIDWTFGSTFPDLLIACTTGFHSTCLAAFARS